MRYTIEDKLPINLTSMNMIVVAIEEILIQVGKVRPLTFTSLKEDKENPNTQTQALLRRMGNEIIKLKKKVRD